MLTSDFERIQRLIAQRAGIHLPQGRNAMVYSRLSRRLRSTGHPSFGAYLDGLEDPDSPEWQEFVNALTTNLTAFFREVHHFHLLEQRLASHPPEQVFRIWCAAASTGEEAYSLAMTATEALGSADRFELVCSDVDTRVLAAASSGIYRADETGGLSEQRLKRFFLRGKNGNAGLVRVKPELQRNIRFEHINLNQPDWPFCEPFDAVFCRNVMIYFDAATQQRVLQRLHQAMRPGGWLFVGHSESFRSASQLFALRGKTVYERR